MIAIVGEDVALPCFDSNTLDLKSCHRVKWIKYGMNNRQVEVILAPHKTKKAQDAGRVKWTPGENGHMSLLLSKLQRSDEGLYGCEIWQDWDCLLVKNISLKVKGKTHRCILTPLVFLQSIHMYLSSFRMQNRSSGEGLVWRVR